MTKQDQLKPPVSISRNKESRFSSDSDNEQEIVRTRGKIFVHPDLSGNPKREYEDYRKVMNQDVEAIRKLVGGLVDIAD